MYIRTSLVCFIRDNFQPSSIRIFILINPIFNSYVFTHVCHSVHGGGVYPSIPCRWCPSMPCRSLGEYVSQHALQVSRPTPRGALEGSGQGGLQAHTRGVEGSGLGGLQAYTWGGGCIPACTEADPPTS